MLLLLLHDSEEDPEEVKLLPVTMNATNRMGSWVDDEMSDFFSARVFQSHRASTR